MLKAELYRRMTKLELIRHVEKLRVQYIKGDCVLFPVSKIQKTILDAFEVKYPSVVIILVKNLGIMYN
jgi:hypothetical protein